jgi:hypothetical protein
VSENSAFYALRLRDLGSASLAVTRFENSLDTGCCGGAVAVVDRVPAAGVKKKSLNP